MHYSWLRAVVGLSERSMQTTQMARSGLLPGLTATADPTLVDDLDGGSCRGVRHDCVQRLHLRACRSAARRRGAPPCTVIGPGRHDRAPPLAMTARTRGWDGSQQS
jgi:hypothetical protein